MFVGWFDPTVLYLLPLDPLYCQDFHFWFQFVVVEPHFHGPRFHPHLSHTGTERAEHIHIIITSAQETDNVIPT